MVAVHTRGFTAQVRYLGLKIDSHLMVLYIRQMN